MKPSTTRLALANGHPFAFFTEASRNLADDKELLDAMREAGFLRVFIGIETPDPKLLKLTLKTQNVHGDQLDKLRRVREHGIHINAGLIVGFDGEDRGVFETQRAFVQASGIGVAMLGLLQAVPGTQLWRRLEKEGRLLSQAQVSGIGTLEGINFIPRGDGARVLWAGLLLLLPPEPARRLHRPRACEVPHVACSGRAAGSGDSGFAGGAPLRSLKVASVVRSGTAA